MTQDDDMTRNEAGDGMEIDERSILEVEEKPKYSAKVGQEAPITQKLLVQTTLRFSNGGMGILVKRKIIEKEIAKGKTRKI